MREPLRATFFALHHRGRHGVLLRATVAFAVLSSALMGAALLAMSFAFGDLLSWSPGGPPQAPNPSGMLWSIPLVFLVAFFYALVLASYEAACLRWLIRGEARGWSGLTVDDDAWRVYGAYWIWLGIYVGWALAYVILKALLARLLGAEHWGVWVGLGVLGFAALVSIVSLAPATAATVAKKRFAFFEATQATDERFLPLLGSFAVILVGQWLLQQGATVAWWTWALGADWVESFRGVSDYFSLARAQSEVTSAAVVQTGEATVWLISGASFLLSLSGMVLMFGVNARAVLLAIQERRIVPDAA